MQKIRNIEFLRVIGCLAIVAFHLFNKLNEYFGDVSIYNQLHTATSNGQKAVELFFIISGFFFALKLNLVQSLWDFVKAKALRFYPMMIFSTGLVLLFYCLHIIKYKIYHIFVNFLFLNGTPLVMSIGFPGVFWYISSLMWTFILYFYLLKNFDRKIVNLIIALLTILSYGVVLHVCDGGIYGHSKVVGNFINLGMLRAFGGVGLGYFIAQWYNANIEKIKTLSLSLKQKFLITLVEGYCLFFIIRNLFIHKLNYNNHFIFVIFFVLTIMLFLVRQGLISKLCDNNLCVFFSKFTFAFYTTHTVVFAVLHKTLWTNISLVQANPILNIIISLVIACFVCVLGYYIADCQLANYFKKHFLKNGSNPVIANGGAIDSSSAQSSMRGN